MTEQAPSAPLAAWQTMESAPKDGTHIEVLHADAQLDLVEWEEYRACVLGSRAGSFGPGWQAVENKLPVDEPVFWRHTQEGGESVVARDDAPVVPLQSPSEAWQPIETAPKDGTLLILWWPLLPHGKFEVGSFRVDEMGFRDKEPHWFDESYDDYALGYASHLLNPTHWRPMPAPPVAAVTAAESKLASRKED